MGTIDPLAGITLWKLWETAARRLSGNRRLTI
jgi:hypothetical protein